MEEELTKVKKKLKQVVKECDEFEGKQVLRLINIRHDDDKVRFYTGFSSGFSSMAALMVCYVSWSISK